MNIELRQPTSDDGIHVCDLVRQSAFLDNNSLYCYLAVCAHFSTTSAVAYSGEQLMGFITAYSPPRQPDTLFVWQVAVHSAAQNQGLASRMLDQILERSYCRQITFVETSVTTDNKASRAMFAALARRHKCELKESVMFDRYTHFRNLHDTEYKLTIGPVAGRHSTDNKGIDS